MGSVKDLTVINAPSETQAGLGRFAFSDRYSVFDWGEMPDHIDGKGAALCVIGAHFFELLAREGVPVHYRGLFDGDGRIKRLGELTAPSCDMAVSLYRVLRPAERDGSYDYARYADVNNNYLVPLEVIYRNRLPEGASVFARLREGTVTLAELGLTEMPAPGAILDRPILDVSTKLEVTDRYITWPEAQAISGLLDGEMDTLRGLTLRINETITREAERIGLANEDGKIEFAIDEHARLTVVDVLGTPDECRFTWNGLHVSKELARVFYRGSAWHAAVERAKREDRINWKSRVDGAPAPLPAPLARNLSHMYQAVANGLTGRDFFPVPPLAEVMKQVALELGALRREG
ncbi:MAG TPA: phosphoribosylaminoimidazolesuccinocarboxamide synthase [Spirochaetota bacterium]|nr:phosphoribosylaminoimidazolesuccinocarboxamide synthase [Spirochaetota bacterium]HPI23693.1 phosphoribosylaminoimidazolesuccinocarboxamide synthase [Spirochaetota bacterium]HPU87335.1 phosphoribosylaminoimidazolesuccinocarboxamide synthase [Spirochaetota bacterium]